MWPESLCWMDRSKFKAVHSFLQLFRGSSGQLSIKSKLILMLLLVSGLSTLLTAALCYRSGQINLTDRVFNQLTSVRASKGSQIEAYFRNIENHTLTLSEDLSISVKTFRSWPPFRNSIRLTSSWDPRRCRPTQSNCWSNTTANSFYPDSISSTLVAPFLNPIW